MQVHNLSLLKAKSLVNQSHGILIDKCFKSLCKPSCLKSSNLKLEICFFIGGGCGIGLGLGWGFGTGFGSQYRSSRVTFHGIEFGRKEESDGGESKALLKSSWEGRASQ